MGSDCISSHLLYQFPLLIFFTFYMVTFIKGKHDLISRFQNMFCVTRRGLDVKSERILHYLDQ